MPLAERPHPPRAVMRVLKHIAVGAEWNAIQDTVDKMIKAGLARFVTSSPYESGRNVGRWELTDRGRLALGIPLEIDQRQEKRREKTMPELTLKISPELMVEILKEKGFQVGTNPRFKVVTETPKKGSPSIEKLAITWTVEIVTNGE